MSDEKMHFDSEETMPFDTLIKLRSTRSDIEETLDKYKINPEECISLMMNFIERSIDKVYRDKSINQQYEVFTNLVNNYIIKRKQEFRDAGLPLDYQPKEPEGIKLNKITSENLLNILVEALKAKKDLDSKDKQLGIIKNPHEFEMHCTLCDAHIMVKPNTTYTLPNEKIKHMKTEGCPKCYKGKGNIITHISYYDKDNKCLLSIDGSELKTYDIKKMQEKIMSL